MYSNVKVKNYVLVRDVFYNKILKVLKQKYHI